METKRQTKRHIAFATKDGQVYTTEHFGAAEIYAIYSFDGVEFKHLEDLRNTTEEESEDGEQGKAQSILDLLVMRKVDIVVAKRFGPNIRRIRHRLIPVIASSEDVSTTLPSLEMEWEKIAEICDLPPTGRSHFVLGSSESGSRTVTGKMFANIKKIICLGCMRCKTVCPVDAISKGDDAALIDNERCVACGACVSMCPVDAIELVTS